jgi:hypothetical protein
MFNNNCLLFETLYGINIDLDNIYCSEGKSLVTKFEFGGSFGMSLEGDCNELEVTSILELFVTLGMSLEGVFHELYT